jgi:hypothetical protein
MKALIREEKGTVIVMAALMMVVLLGFTALAIDGGNLYFRHTKLQDIADSCALAGCTQLGEEKNAAQKQDAAFNKAVDYVVKNGLTDVKYSSTFCEDITYKGEPGVIKVSFPEAYEVKVDISINTKLYFAQVLGFSQTPVNVSATAGLVEPLEHQGGFAPLCFFWEDAPIPHGTYNLSLKDGVNGNYGYIDYQPNDFFNYLQNGYPGTLGIYDPISDDPKRNTEIYYTDLDTAYNTVPTYPGLSAGEIDRAIQYRIDYCKAYQGDACKPDNYKENCPRVVILPIVDNFFDSHGKSYKHILGFTRFFILGYDSGSKILTGEFIESVDENTANGRVPTDDCMLQSVKLVE